MVDLAASWHMLELHVRVREAAGREHLVADARTFRVVHLVSSPHRGAVSFGSRGGCRLANSATNSVADPGGQLQAQCVLRPLEWVPEAGYEVEEEVTFALDDAGVYGLAVQVALALCFESTPIQPII